MSLDLRDASAEAPDIIAALKLQPHPRRRPLPRDFPRCARNGRARVRHQHLFSAVARRSIAMASRRRRGNLAVAGGRAAAARHRLRGRAVRTPARPQPARRRDAAGDGSGRRLAGGAQPRRVDAGLVRGGAVRIRGVRTGAAGVVALRAAPDARDFESAVRLRLSHGSVNFS